MHPTADTPLLIFRQSGGAAGDAGRSGARILEIPNGGLRLATARGSFTSRHSSSIRGRASDCLRRGVARGASLRVGWVAGGACCLGHAPEQANAPDRRHAGFHQQQSRGAAGDWRRSAALWRNWNVERLRARYSRKKTVAGDVRGMI